MSNIKQGSRFDSYQLIVTGLSCQSILVPNASSSLAHLGTKAQLRSEAARVNLKTQYNWFCEVSGSCSTKWRLHAKHFNCHRVAQEICSQIQRPVRSIYHTQYHTEQFDSPIVKVHADGLIQEAVPYLARIRAPKITEHVSTLQKRLRCEQRELDVLSYQHQTSQKIVKHESISATHIYVNSEKIHLMEQGASLIEPISITSPLSSNKHQQTVAIQLTCGFSGHYAVDQGVFYHGYYQFLCHEELVSSGKLCGPLLDLKIPAEKIQSCRLFVYLLPSQPYEVQQKPYHPKQVFNNQYSTKLTLDMVPNKVIDVYVHHPAVVCNLRLDRLSNPMYQKSEMAGYFSFLSQFNPGFDSEYYAAYMRSLLAYFRDESCVPDAYQRAHLRAGELAYFEANGESVTIFLHGYDINYGHFGSALAAEVGDNNNTTTSLSAFGLETAWRDRASLKRRYGNVLGNIDLAAVDDLNGSGVFNWFVQMEHNLNLAAGWLPSQSCSLAKPFKRLLNIAWQGNPRSPLDYLCTELTAQLTAVSIVKLVKGIREKHPSMKINILAHSEGCAVAVYAMELLGRGSSYFNEVILWEAAVPNTVLSSAPAVNRPTLTKRWGTTHAANAAKSLTILASRFDAILGPFDVYHDQYKIMSRKLKAPDGGRQEGLLAFVMQCLGDLPIVNKPESVYHLAQLFGLSLDKLLLHKSAREILYQRFCSNVQVADLPLSLDLLVNQFQSSAQYGSIFSKLSLFFGVMLSLVFNYLAQYLNQDGVHQRFSQVQMNHDLDASDQFFEELFQHFLKDTTPLSNDKRSKLAKLVALGLEKSGLELLAKKAAHWLVIDGLYNGASLPDYVPNPIQDLKIAVERERNHWVFGDGFAALKRIVTENLALESLDSSVDLSWIDTAADQMSAIVLVVLTTKDLDVVPALGVVGPEVDASVKQMMASGKLEVVHQDFSAGQQHATLASHSGMKYPSAEYLKQVYHDVICRKLDF